MTTPGWAPAITLHARRQRWGLGPVRWSVSSLWKVVSDGPVLAGAKLDFTNESLCNLGPAPRVQLGPARGTPGAYSRRGVTKALVERLGGMTCTQDDVSGLGAKLDALELTDGESAALHAIFDAATHGEEVEGYAFGVVSNQYFSLRLNSLAARGIIIVGG